VQFTHTSIHPGHSWRREERVVTDVALQLAEMETLRGQLPLSVAAWYQVVGSVNFTGLAPESWWQMGSRRAGSRRGPPAVFSADLERDRPDEWLVERGRYTYDFDPIDFWPLADGLQRARSWDALLRGEIDVDISHWRDQYIPIIPMGPDMHTKYDYRGGGPIGVRAPEPSADGLFGTEDYRGLFVDYRRLCCRHAGLPGLRDLPTWRGEHGVHARVEQIERAVRFLTEHLLPFSRPRHVLRLLAGQVWFRNHL
jgi:hypothetical protein